MNVEQNPQEQPAPQPEQQQTTSQPRTYNPFIDVVNEKPYTQMNVNVGANQVGTSIPEPVFAANTINANENPYKMLNDDFGASMGGAQKPNAPINPAMNNLPDGDAKMGAEHMAKLIVDGYEQLHLFANKALQIPERKLRKLESEGEIDLSVEIPYDYGKSITAGDFIKEFNEQNKDTLTVSKEFKKEVTPVLTRVLQKRGAGLTDEQYLAYLFGKDIVVKGVIFNQIKGTANDMINVIKDYTLALRQNGVAPMQRQKVEKTTPPPPSPDEPQSDYYDVPKPSAPTPVYPDVEVDADDFNFRTNETVVESTVQKHKVPESGKARLMAQKKRDREIAQAMAKYGSEQPVKSSYEEAMSKRKNQSGKRGRKPKDYVKMSEEQIAEAIVLNEQKPIDKDKIEGLD
jgi:hypothetical protein